MRIVVSMSSDFQTDPYLLQIDLQYWWNWKENISIVATQVTPDHNTGVEVRDAMNSGAM
jgi:hypothetical protein